MINRKQLLSGRLHLKLYYWTHPQLLWNKKCTRNISLNIFQAGKHLLKF